MIARLYNFIFALFTQTNFVYMLIPICGIVSLSFILIHVRIVYKVKIFHFFWSYFFVGLYIMFYIGFFMLLRIYQIGRTLDLRTIWERYMLMFHQYEQFPLFGKFLAILLFILVILFWILVFVKIRALLENQLWKLFFYHKNIGRILDRSSNWVSSYSEKCRRISYDSFVFVLYRIVKRLSYQEQQSPTRYEAYIKVFDKIARYVKLFICGSLIGLVAYECIINNFTLFYTFYYLPLYILIMLWIRVSNVIDHSSGTLEEILIERAYADDIIYVNITEEEERLLVYYIANPKLAQRANHRVEYIRSGPFNLLIHPIQFFGRYVWVKGKDHGEPVDFYLNEYMEKGMYKAEVITKDGKYFVNEDIRKTSRPLETFRYDQYY